MIKVYMPISDSQIGGGWTFARNFKRGMAGLVEFVSELAAADLVFIAGVTMVERDLIEQAHQLGKKIVFRMDNVPRKSRNKRSRVYDNIKRYSELADIVVYQSEWAKNYCMPMSGDGEVIVNGVDQKIFYPAPEQDPEDRQHGPVYLFAYHGKNEIKGFWLAHYLFQRYARENPKSEFWFIYNFKGEIGEQMDSNFDFWNGEKYRHLDPVQTEKEMAELLRQVDFLVYPAFCDAAPNMVLEARACNVPVVGTLDPAWSGVAEMLDPVLDISVDRMCREYLGLFNLLTGEHSVQA